ncbi:MAG TPA: DUF1501 domain-containing protein [Pirellulaceae bacterium]|nr:DUF1501 domain-containing protein [Pirellulaceae bacterium]
MNRTSTRRSFLQSALGSSAVISLGATAPAVFQQAMAADNKAKETVLVVVQLSGGNDGLNTVIPFDDPVYQKDRPKLAIPSTDVLSLADGLGFHPSARGLANLLEDDQLAIVQGIGYPNPNHSHFESMDIWHTCQRKRKGNPRTTGWLGRYLDGASSATGGDPSAVHLGAKKQPLALAADTTRVPSIRSLERFRLQDSGDGDVRSVASSLVQVERDNGDPLLSFIQTSTTAALDASQRVEEVRRDYQTPVEYPDHDLATKLRTVAQLIDAGLKTRVYYLQLDGFDTHSQQAAAHAVLLGRLGGAVEAFIKDVSHHGHGERVLVMAFSEFGRRVKENASEGTDHGAAAPLFLAGSKVRAGLHGQPVSLTDLQDGDVKFHTDFRRVYATVLENWLGVPSQALLGAEHKPLDILSV